MLQKTGMIGDKEVRFRSSATIPRLYRIKFKRDIFKDLAKLETSYKKNGGGDEAVSYTHLDVYKRQFQH